MNMPDNCVTLTACFNFPAAPSQQLYVRLFQRKHAWLQVAKLDYKRIAKDLTPVVAELCEAGLIQTGKRNNLTLNYRVIRSIN